MSESVNLPAIIPDFFSPIGSLDAYIARVRTIPSLSEDEERELAVAWYERQDVGAAYRLVMSGLRFVVSIAREYKGYGLPLEDIIQEGNIGLMNAVKRFDPSVGVRLVTFAVHWIKSEINEYVVKNWRIVKMATTKAQRKLFYNLRRMTNNVGEWISGDDVKRVSSELNVPEREVLLMDARLRGQDAEFDPRPSEEFSGGPASYLFSENDDPAYSVEEENHEMVVTSSVRAAIDSLDERTREIVMGRWMKEPKATLQELGDRFNISCERVRQIEMFGMKKLRERLSVLQA